jgi:uncharacterized membrane protein (UPF0127 family)
VLFLCLALPAALALAACAQRPAVVIRAARGPVTVEVEVADTPDSRARGLMYRRDLAPQAGMLFIFPTPSEQRFWMKNTPLSLDMVFISSDRTIVGIVPDTRPFTTDPLGVSGASQYVLEVHAGFCAQHGIAAGDKVEFVRVGPSAD